MGSTTEPGREAAPLEGRSGRKRRAVLDAAREVFLEHGYPAASMDEIAALAGVSKMTVYKHFSDKRGLFVAVFTGAIEEAEASTRPLIDELGESVDLVRDLRAFARRHVTLVTQPHLIRLRRMVIAETTRFPELARAWHQSAPERGHATLAAQIDRLVQRGFLQVSDSLLAAQHLNYLILSVPLDEALFTGSDRPYSRRRLQYYADEAVRVFMAAYGTETARQPPRPQGLRNTR